MNYLPVFLFIILPIFGTLGSISITEPSKVSTALIQELETKGTGNIFISLTQGDTGPILAQIESQGPIDTRAQKLYKIMTQLKAHATETQEPVIQFLRNNEAFQNVAGDIRSLWITNQIYIPGADLNIINSLTSLPSVSRIEPEEVVPLHYPIESFPSSSRTTGQGQAEWGVNIIQAPKAWSIEGGNSGAGVIVSNLDTGARPTHQALKSNFLGAYGWYDPGKETPTPNDLNGHGTHTIGTIAGQGGIGVAPGAQWSACKGCASNYCSEYDLKRCGEFVLCPFLPNGSNPNCAKAPHVVSCSWGGGQGSKWFNKVIDAWHAGGIIPVFSQGNNGPYCASANSPGDQHVIGVGSTTSSDFLSDFSSKGPSVTGVLKPDISAPGSSVTSAYHTSDTAYQTMSGTSMAAPHVAGVVALLLSHEPKLNFTQVLHHLSVGADTEVKPSDQDCGGIPETQFPNHAFGAGRLNAFKALASLMKSQKQG